MQTNKQFLVLSLCTILSSGLCACALTSEKSKESKKIISDSSNSDITNTKIENTQLAQIGQKSGDLLVVYPRGENNNRIDTSSTFIVGTLLNKAKILKINNDTVACNTDGFFAHPVKLRIGINQFLVQAVGNKADTNDLDNSKINITVERPAPPATLPSNKLIILKETIIPAEKLLVTAGDTIQFSVRATPAAHLKVFLGSHALDLKPAIQSHPGKKPVVNLGLDTAFGVRYQRQSQSLKDLYLGFYKVQATDKWQDLKPIFVLSDINNQKSLKVSANCTISTLKQPEIFFTKHNNTTVRLGPGQARITPLAENVRLTMDGCKGEWLRLELCPNKHVWIKEADLERDLDNNTPASSTVSTINIESDSYGSKVVVPLNQRLPYQVEQDISGKKLTLKIFGATADTDFITSDLYPQDPGSSKLIDFLSWKQKQDSCYELTVNLKDFNQWGFYADYENNNLILHIKQAPKLTETSNNSNSLEGTIICIDPGHGGKESGSIGCSGIKESVLNLAIASKLAGELKSKGCKVILTRDSDIDVSLEERVQTAIAAKSDLLISIHNNALPDGRDPLIEHGTSSYWYHPQSVELAKFLRESLAKQTGLKDYGTRYQNLALCRPSQMPAVLMEIAFMINPDELSLLLKEEFQYKVAKSIAKNIESYLKLKIQSNNKLNETP